jgi:hypothetical protein
MFKHDKALLHEVKVDSPNPNYAAMLQEQLGGPQGELKAAMQYLSQSFRIKDPQIKDLFLDIAAEELSHMEMIATTINLLNGHELNANNATIGAVEAHVLTGLTPMLSNASGQLWTAVSVKAFVWRRRLLPGVSTTSMRKARHRPRRSSGAAVRQMKCLFPLYVHLLCTEIQKQVNP